MYPSIKNSYSRFSRLQFLELFPARMYGGFHFHCFALLTYIQKWSEYWIKFLHYGVTETYKSSLKRNKNVTSWKEYFCRKLRFLLQKEVQEHRRSQLDTKIDKCPEVSVRSICLKTSGKVFLEFVNVTELHHNMLIFFFLVIKIKAGNLKLGKIPRTCEIVKHKEIIIIKIGKGFMNKELKIIWIWICAIRHVGVKHVIYIFKFPARIRTQIAWSFTLSSSISLKYLLNIQSF